MADLTSTLIEQVNDAIAEERQLQIIGSGSKAFYGRQATGEPLNLAEHSGVVSYQPEELVLTVRAGTSLETIEKVLGENGQMIAADPPRFGGKGTIGGSLASNLSGPARPWLGSLRDQVLGIKLINGRGELLNFGGQVMKNVAGYDLSRLQAGSMGCLGVITEISLKVLPIPQASRTVSFEIEDPPQALRTVNSLAAKSLNLAGACWFSGCQYVRFSGAEKAVDAAIADLRREQQGVALIEGEERFWSDLRDHRLEFFTGEETLWRASVAAMESLPGESNSLIDWGGSQRWIRNKNSVEQITECENLRGEISLFRGREGDQEVFPEASLVQRKLHQRLKAEFDPNGIFNPGRLYGWL